MSQSPEPIDLGSYDLLRHFNVRSISSIHRNRHIMRHATRVGKHWRWRASDLEAIRLDLRQAEAEANQ